MQHAKYHICQNLVSDGLNDDQKHFQQVALDFAKEEMAPYMIQWDLEVRGCEIILQNK